jgi:plastocyanin
MNFARTFALFVALVLAGDLGAGSLDVTVKDGSGGPVSDAVVFAKSNAIKSATAKRQIVIDQREKQFVPYVTALQAGTAVMFPNSDDIRHHVYSFSPTKKFELPLYAGVPAEPVLFDKVGFVTLGCNIHDWMVAYVAVLPTPYFQITGKEGRAVLKDLPSGQYTVEVWQPSLRGTPEKFAQDVDLTAGGAKELTFNLDLKPDFRVKRAPGLSSGGYR